MPTRSAHLHFYINISVFACSARCPGPPIGQWNMLRTKTAIAVREGFAIEQDLGAVMAGKGLVQEIPPRVVALVNEPSPLAPILPLSHSPYFVFLFRAAFPVPGPCACSTMVQPGVTASRHGRYNSLFAPFQADGVIPIELCICQRQCCICSRVKAVGRGFSYAAGYPAYQ